jgi:site-specific recombinase XerD
MPPRKLTTLTLAERYDQSLQYGRGKHVPEGMPRPRPTGHWPQENIALLERYERWLLGGGVSEMVVGNYHIPMAGHVFGLTLKPHSELDLDHDLDCALAYVESKGVSEAWSKNCHLALVKFRRFLRLERGLGEESHETPFDSAHVTAGLPAWLVNELDRYQRLMQRNWRGARMEQNIRRFWSGYLRLWRFLVEQRGVQSLADLKRQHVLDYVDMRLAAGYSVSGVTGDLRNLRTFLVFLQEEGYSVPNSLLRIPGLKQPDPLPRYLTDEQVKKLREEIERGVREATLASHRRLALLVRAAFYLLWQGGLRLGEVEELRLEDLDFAQKRLSVRDGKGRKDRTVYLAETAIRAVLDFLAVRGDGSGDHVFLYRNAPLRKDIIRANLQYAGERVGVKVFPHRLRHTCATQLLNAGCRVTSIQRFLGHKKLSSTMIYARAHDQTVAEDYFAAMERVEQRLEVTPPKQEETVTETTPKPEYEQVLALAEELSLPELSLDGRLAIAQRLRDLFGAEQALSPPEENMELVRCEERRDDFWSMDLNNPT